MRKTTITMVLFLLVVISTVAAQGGSRGLHEPGTGIAEPELYEEAKGTGQGMQESAEVQTQNQGEEQQIQTRTELQAGEGQGRGEMVQTRMQARQQLNAGNYMTQDGKQLKVQAKAQNRMSLMVGNTEASSSLQLNQEQVQERTRLHAQLSNGRNAEIKVMPDTAAQKAQERLRLKVCNAENGCSLELKEVGSGEKARAAYQVQAQKESKVFGLFKKQMNVQAQVDAETGQVIQAKKAWWAFLATEE
ncbi:hypothetical protein KY362_02570 [Candidatus Woesearchaeota archaeon]|nr:hypothetical protein [Candidatus Woesearchaeota archaeon]